MKDTHRKEQQKWLIRFPLVPGHEVVGHVIAVGSSVTELNVGDVVGLGALAQACGECEFCKDGLDNLCPNRMFTHQTANDAIAKIRDGSIRFRAVLKNNLI